MDVSDVDNKPETTQDQEAESIAVDDFVREIAKDQDPDDPAADFADEDRENSEKLDVGLDPVAETEPSLDSTKPVESLPEELTQFTEEDPVEIEQSLGEANGVSEAVIENYVSKEIDSVPGQNGYSDPIPSQLPDPALDEANGVSYKETTLPDSVVTTNVVPKSIDVGESDVPEVPHSTENRGYVSVTPLPLQRTSWRDCCGLFHIMKRSDQ